SSRCDELQEIFDELKKGSSYGPSTTHWSKLIPRLEGGSGGGCPVLAFGISKELYIRDV
ncbi:MAG: restriction endonuclease, partial [Chloroflexi bacterium]|nr:restriction endonuclease [Chloroflexota bacterium]